MSRDIVAKKLAVSVLFDTVSVQLICADDYGAQVLYDDIVDRMESGEGINLTVLMHGEKNEGSVTASR